MTIVNAKTADAIKNREKSRRSFLQKLGFGVSTAAASSLVLAKPAADNTLALQLARMEAEQALHALHQQYEQAMDAAQMDTALSLFSADAEVIFNGGVFKARHHGISRLYLQHFALGNIGKRMQAAPGFALSAEQQRQQLDIAPDMLSARALLPYSIQVGKPMQALSSLISMAQSQGEGVRSWWEGGVYEVDYVRDAASGRWMINRLVYNTLSRADFRVGRSYAKPIQVATFTTCFAQDGIGPDALV